MVCKHCDATVPPAAKFCPGCGNPPDGEAKPKRNRSLIALLVIAVVVGGMMFCGIIAAIAIPNFLNAVDRGKQKRTMADMRVIATAIEQYEVDHEAYPVVADLDALRPLVEGEYIRVLPHVDGWGNPIHVESTEASYRLTSGGKDGVLQGCGGGQMSRFNDDICFAAGEFNQWPEGAQR